MKIITRKQAKEQGMLRYFTGTPCKRGHLSSRLVSTGKCDVCHRLYHDKYIKHWQRKNKEKVNHATRKWRRDNPDQAHKTNKEYYSSVKEIKSEKNKRWRALNVDRLRRYNSVRRAQIKQAMPLWADLSKIQDKYTQAVQMSNRTGILYHVDHIIPLGGELVCGLHCEDNLQVIPASENLAKGNKIL